MEMIFLFLFIPFFLPVAEGGEDAKKKRKKRKGRGGKGSQKQQTDPPSIPIAELFPEGKSYFL